MGQALYRKYRSKSLDEIVGQEHITTTLANALKQGNISHAYLLTGPKGVGKTSIARILAHAVNNLPYSEGAVHLDIIEIDAASNRGIEEIRDLRDKAQVAPTSAKYKVYIIDEVHMLTKQAFNALLKTLEEPPAHVIFILATTEAHKLPDTIISRTQRFTFKPIDHNDVAKHLRNIANKEHIAITDEALELIAGHGEGSFRDSISLLDQASSGAGQIEADDVRTLLGVPPATAISETLDTLLGGNPETLLQQLDNLSRQGFNPTVVAKKLGTEIRLRLLAGDLDIPITRALDLLHELLAVPSTREPQQYLELILLGVNLHGQLLSDAKVAEPTQASPEPSPRPKTKPLPTQKSTQTSKPPAQMSPQHAPEEPSQNNYPNSDQPFSAKTSTASLDVPKGSSSESEQLLTRKSSGHSQGSYSVTVPKATTGALLDIWSNVLATVKNRHNTLYSILRMAEPSLAKDELTLAFVFPFHQKKINEDKSRLIVREVMKELTGKEIRVTCIVEKSANPPEAQQPHKTTATKAAEDDLLGSISNIFGGGEVLES